MFEIYGGATEFNQWEQGKRLTNDDMRIGDKVTFHDSTGHTVIMTAYDHNGTVVADVPNTMLRTPYAVVVTLGNGSSALPEERTKLNVVAADKPADYEFIDNRPAPVSLEKRIEALEAGGGPDWNASEGEEGHIKNRTHYDPTIVYDSVTQTIPDSSTVPNGYGTLPNVYLLSNNLVMPEGKYILFQMGSVKHKFYSLPPNTGSASRPTYKEDITLDNGVTIRWQLDRNDPVSGRPDTKRYWFQVRPLFNAELSPYFGQTFSVSLCEGEIKKLDPKFLPEGYPYVEEGAKGNVTHIYDIDADYPDRTELVGFPLFAVGDTVSVTVNGVKYSLVAFEDEGVPVIGDAFFDAYSGSGQYGWCVYSETDGKVYINNKEDCTVSWDFSKVIPMDEKFLPDGIGDVLNVLIIEPSSNSFTCNKTYNEIKEALLNNVPVIAIISIRYGHGEESPKQCIYQKVEYSNYDSAIYFSRGEDASDLVLTSDNVVQSNSPM